MNINLKKIWSTLQLLSIPKMKKILIYGDEFVLYEKGKVCNMNQRMIILF